MALWATLQEAVSREYRPHLSLESFYLLFASIQSGVFCFVVKRNQPNDWSLRLGTKIKLIAISYGAVVGYVGLFCVEVWCICQKGPVYIHQCSSPSVFPLLHSRASSSLVKSSTLERSNSRCGGDSSGLSFASVPPTPRSENEILESSNLQMFGFNELKIATRNFRPDSVLGEGGFGCVFKGWIDEHTFKAARPGTGIVIAVKRLNQEGLQGHKEWLTEIMYLGQLYHPNLVKLIGYCLEDEHRMLVYEFMPKGSLENHLFRRSAYFQPLSWKLRMKVALGAAKGLAYLHSPEAKVIYRDFKCSNILLDSDYNAKLSDFGLAKDGPIDGQSHVSTRVMGTYGYAAPEYMATGHLTAKSDVYSFGVVLLEMLTGRRVLDKNRPSREQNLIEWTKPYLTSKQRILYIMDGRIEGQYSMAGAFKATNLTMQCLQLEPRHRPKMQDVVKILEDLQDMEPDSSISVRQQVVHNKNQTTCAVAEASSKKKATTSSHSRTRRGLSATPVVS